MLRNLALIAIKTARVLHSCKNHLTSTSTRIALIRFLRRNRITEINVLFGTAATKTMPPKKTNSKDSAKKTSKHATAVSPSDFPKPIRDYWEKLDWGDLSDLFGDRTLQRGRSYASSRYVKSLWVTEDGRHLLAVVLGTYEYNTLVSLKQNDRKKQLGLSSTCSCPVGFNCKHGVAAIVRFLDFFAAKQAIPLCRECENEETWEIVTENGKSNTVKIDFDEHTDEDDWNEDEDEDTSISSPKIDHAVSTKSTKKDDLEISLEVSLKNKLDGKTKEELVAVILQFFHEYDAVREYFVQEAFVESVAKSGNLAKLVEKAIKLIDKEFAGVSHYDYDPYRHYDDGPTVDLDSVVEVVKQFGKFDDALAAVDRVARHLIEKGGQYLEETEAEDVNEIDGVFQVMAETLIASQTPPISIILWAYEISGVGGYDIGSYEIETTILKRDWPVKVWSDVADTMLVQRREKSPENKDDWPLQTIVETLDKAHRQEEATKLLRSEAANYHELGFFVDRLIKLDDLEEAEKISWEQRPIELANEKPGFYHGHCWSNRLKRIAEKKKDWATKASIEAMEFFEHPWTETIQAILLTSEKMKIEPIVRCSIEKFLQTGKFPNAVQKSLDGVKLTVKDRKDWPIPYFAFQVDKEKATSPRLDVLCEWAIAEKRPNDVVRWFDELAKEQPPSRGFHREISREKVADAICETHPERAFRLYRDLAEHEMEVTRNYYTAIHLLRKARQTLETSGRRSDWKALIAEIRATHRRKTSLMKLLTELEAGSIVNQKRNGK